MNRSLAWILLLVMFYGGTCVAVRAALEPPPAVTSDRQLPVATCQAVFNPATSGGCTRRAGQRRQDDGN